MTSVAPKKAEQGPVIFSYSGDCESLASNVYQYLKKKLSCPVWMDKHDAENTSFTTSLAESVQNCSMVVCFLTPQYQNDPTCERELTYAANLAKPILPCIVGSTNVFDENDEDDNDEDEESDPDWFPSAWLGLLISDHSPFPFQDVTENNFNQKCEQLTLKIENILKKKANK